MLNTLSKLLHERGLPSFVNLTKIFKEMNPCVVLDHELGTTVTSNVKSCRLVKSLPNDFSCKKTSTVWPTLFTNITVVFGSLADP